MEIITYGNNDMHHSMMAIRQRRMCAIQYSNQYNNQFIDIKERIKSVLLDKTDKKLPFLFCFVFPHFCPNKQIMYFWRTDHWNCPCACHPPWNRNRSVFKEDHEDNDSLSICSLWNTLNLTLFSSWRRKCRIRLRMKMTHSSWRVAATISSKASSSSSSWRDLINCRKSCSLLSLTSHSL